mmetsp:Transcript_5000/g.7287  ORF Transcript_5000/g.7287 Transcript_5000/m.7287 type:complete len:88 (-) Transcript_5000:460-723(-)
MHLIEFVNCPDVETEHRYFTWALGKVLVFAQQEVVKIPQRLVWFHRRFVVVLLMCLTGAIMELHVSSHSEARVLLFLEIHSLAGTPA